VKGETLKIKIYKFRGETVVDITKDVEKHGMVLTLPILAEEKFDDITVVNEQ